ncbi:pyridoxal phosphate-dependent aminotransferase [candidate division KSB1 bacterium]|nr:pyridoxal phosphate-dependent aminotransferase [candidate division KSB1 bacterium]
MISQYITEAMERSSWIRRMFDVGQEMKRKYGVENVYDLTLGNPLIEPPDKFFEVLATLSVNTSSGRHRYMSNAGFEDVRRKVAHYLTKNQILETEAEHIVMTIGVGGGLNVILKTILNPGDEVIILAPFFAEYVFYIQNHQGVVVIAETTTDFDLDLEEIDRKITEKTKAIIINSPNNPSGRLYSDERLNQFVDLLNQKQKQFRHDIYLISDEPYRDIVYDRVRAPSVCAKYDNSFFGYSWSKSLSIPGDRIGYIAANPKMTDIKKTMNGLIFSNRILGFINAPAVMQMAVGKLLYAHVKVSYYERKRDRIYQALVEAGYDVYKPEGTFYFFPKCPSDDEIEFINVAKENRVLLVPGRGFGRPGYFRIAYCTDDRTIERALDHLYDLPKKVKQ